MSKNAYDFYLDKCLLPVTPQKLQIKINNANSTVTLINEGEVNILKTAKLTDIEFECRIPQTKYPFAVYPSGFRDAAYYLDYFEQLKTGRKPFQFIVSRTLPTGRVLFSTNMKVSMENYGVTEQAKDGFDLMVKIKLVSIKSAETADGTASASVTETRAAESGPAPETPQTYIVVKGDCLYTIARKFYGDGAKYIAIYEANKDVIGGNPNRIYPGQELIIPSAETAVLVTASARTRSGKTTENAKGFSGGAAGSRISQISMR